MSTYLTFIFNGHSVPYRAQPALRGEGTPSQCPAKGLDRRIKRVSGFVVGKTFLFFFSEVPNKRGKLQMPQMMISNFCY